MCAGRRQHSAAKAVRQYMLGTTALPSLRNRPSCNLLPPSCSELQFCAVELPRLPCGLLLKHPTICFADALVATRHLIPDALKSYKLDSVARWLFGVGKMETRHFTMTEYAAASRAERNAYKRYCLVDSRLTQQIWRRLNLGEAWWQATSANNLRSEPRIAPPARVAQHPSVPQSTSAQDRKKKLKQMRSYDQALRMTSSASYK